MRASGWLLAAALVWTGACREVTIEEVTVTLDGGLAPTAFGGPRGLDTELRVSVASILSPTDAYAGYAELVEHLARELGRTVSLSQRRSYRETNELLAAGRIDFAFVCTGGYADLLRWGERVEVLAVPVIDGAMTYQSLVIVPASSRATRLEDLAGKRFAFTDELSLSGFAYPTWAVRQRGLDPRRFFSASYFTASHDRSIEAVARGLVDGAAVDSHVWRQLVKARPALAAQVRIIEQSEPLGVPPVVALERLDPELRARLRAALLSLHQDEDGRRLLERLGIERFAEPPEALYGSALEVIRGAGR